MVLGFETVVFIAHNNMQPVRDLAVYICIYLYKSTLLVYAFMFPAGSGDCGDTRGVWGEGLQSDHKDVASKVSTDLLPRLQQHSTNEE